MRKFIVGENNFTFVKWLVLVQILKPSLFNNGIEAVLSFKSTQLYNLYQNEPLDKSKVILSHY